jgi:hypothetical protein
LHQHISVERIIGEVAIAGNTNAENLLDRKTKLIEKTISTTS